MLSRRNFLKLALFTPFLLAKTRDTEKSLYKEALYYFRIQNKKNQVECQLCPRGCLLGDGDLGFCRARKNINGRLYALGYGAPCAVHVDPIEKKPFFHVIPQSASLSIASAGCNLRCKFCQNWQISQVSPMETVNYELPPRKVVDMAKKMKCKSIAYTYTEPTNFYEYMLDTARIAKKEGILNVSHTNGYINRKPLEELSSLIDAVNVDLKGFDDAFYAKLCEANLKPVLDTLKILKTKGVWIEITNLVIPGYNDREETIREMCIWIKENLGEDVPLHFTRFFPMYLMNSLSPTPVSTLEKAREIAISVGLSYVYLGNVPGHLGENTYCKRCKRAVLKRSGFNLLENNLKDGRCKFCGQEIKGIWKA
ncbi:MAG: AmmeMemoRadiSam system radical SAM enzyme [Deltaproteobacteria bacterium]|nr:AmmeMemoRadiSam system radical SAM enzyme [Deltaproteobacteria bacterium]